MTVDTKSRFASGQILGCRERQEDDYGIVEFGPEGNGLLLAVADGMGGHAGGAEAAQTAIRVFLDVVDAGDGDPAKKLRAALESANVAIGQMTEADSQLAGAGCTFVGAIVANGLLSWVSVGDSSLLLQRDGKITRLNDDHSMRPVFADMVIAGRMTKLDAEKHPNRNALRSALTGENIAYIDEKVGFFLQPEDELLLASDGLDVLNHGTLAHLLKQYSNRSIKESVTAVLNAIEEVRAPRQDNATVLLYRNGLQAGAVKAQLLSKPGRLLFAALVAVTLTLVIAAGLISAFFPADKLIPAAWYWSLGHRENLSNARQIPPASQSGGYQNSNKGGH